MSKTIPEAFLLDALALFGCRIHHSSVSMDGRGDFAKWITSVNLSTNDVSLKRWRMVLKKHTWSQIAGMVDSLPSCYLFLLYHHVQVYVFFVIMFFWSDSLVEKTEFLWLWAGECPAISQFRIIVRNLAATMSRSWKFWKQGTIRFCLETRSNGCMVTLSYHTGQTPEDFNKLFQVTLRILNADYFPLRGDSVSMPTNQAKRLVGQCVWSAMIWPRHARQRILLNYKTTTHAFVIIHMRHMLLQTMDRPPTSAARVASASTTGRHHKGHHKHKHGRLGPCPLCSCLWCPLWCLWRTSTRVNPPIGLEIRSIFDTACWIDICS